MKIWSWLALGAVLAGVGAVVQADSTPYQTALSRWRAATGGFTAWQRSGTLLAADGTLQLDPATAVTETDPYPPGGYNGRSFYNGGSYVAGEATSPETPVAFPYREAIASWNASTPAGTWIEVLLRARVGSRLTKWYNLGVWVAENGAVERHSVNAQGDADGIVAVDTLKLLTKKKEPASAYQVKVRLFSAAAGALPSVANAAVAVSTTPDKPGDLLPGDPAYWSNVLAVPECSQMVYPDGGTVWCSPTSVSMVIAYWQQDAGPCEPRVRAAVAGVYDWLFDGHGNWPFNTAYASSRGLEGFVGRMTTMAEAERWLDAGVPLVVSYAWGSGDLDGAPLPSSNGHLAVIVGFDEDGNPVVNDPAAPADESVRRTYPRAQLEELWLEHSGGTFYAIYPAGWAIPQ
jgi:hypothetical protein